MRATGWQDRKPTRTGRAAPAWQGARPKGFVPESLRLSWRRRLRSAIAQRTRRISRRLPVREARSAARTPNWLASRRQRAAGNDDCHRHHYHVPPIKMARGPADPPSLGDAARSCRWRLQRAERALFRAMATRPRFKPGRRTPGSRGMCSCRRNRTRWHPLTLPRTAASGTKRR